MARRKKRVLVLDLDSQGNISTCLGSKSDKTMYDLLVGGVPPLQCVKEVEEGLFIIRRAVNLLKGGSLIFQFSS